MPVKHNWGYGLGAVSANFDVRAYVIEILDDILLAGCIWDINFIGIHQLGLHLHI